MKGRWQINEWKFNRCPKTEITEDVDFWFKSYQMYKNGFLPNGQAWLKNANKLIEIILFIELIITQHNKELEEKHGKQ